MKVGTSVRNFSGSDAATLSAAVNQLCVQDLAARDLNPAAFLNGCVKAVAVSGVIVFAVRHDEGVDPVVSVGGESPPPTTSFKLGAVEAAGGVDTSSVGSFFRSLDPTSMLVGAVAGAVISR